MRGGRRTGNGGRGRGRGSGDARNRSPSHSRIKEHRSGSGYRGNAPLPCRPRRCSLSPPVDGRGPCQSLSPLPSRPHRSPARPVRRSPSMERDYAVRRSEHGHRPNSLNDEGIDFQHKYMLPDHPTDLNDVHALLKSSRSIKDKVMAGSSSGMDNQGMLVQKSLFLDDGLKRAFYTLPQDLGHPFDSGALNSSDNVRGIGGGSSLNVGMLQYDQRLRDLYNENEREREKLYSKDMSFSTMPPPSQARPFVCTSSSSFSKENEFLRLYGDRGGVGKFLDDPLEYADRGGVGKFLDDPLEYAGYDPVQLADRVRRAPVSPPAREEPLEYGYNVDEPVHRGRAEHGYLPSDGIYHKTVYGSRGEFTDANDSSFLDPAEGRLHRADAYGKKFIEDSFWDQQHSVHGDAAMRSRDLKGVPEDYVGSSRGGYVGYGLKASRDHDLPPYEESYHIVAYRERPNSPLLGDHSMGTSRNGVKPPRERSRMDVDAFDLSRKRKSRRNYVMTDDLNERNVHRRIKSPRRDNDQIWYDEEYEPIEESTHFVPPRRLVIGHSRHRHAEGGRGLSLKKRLRPSPSNFHGSFSSDIRQGFIRPQKVWRRGQDDKTGRVNAPVGDVSVDAAGPMKVDPPEGSDEFKQQIHKAFLRFSKLLNESPHQQKRFREDEGKSSKLLCCVCGSASKEFVDIHSLLTHSYHTLKVGLRTDHLGFHKALCVLNGWNWLVAPDTFNASRRRPPSEIKALKEDLIVWPPIVIVHNNSIGNKSNTNGPKVVSNEHLEEMLREMGFGAGKTRVCGGKPANQNVLLVKFLATLSGLQEAERLQKYYSDKNRGRQGFQDITSSSGSGGENRGEKDEELLYGYMAVAEDLDKLDPETKKRSVVRSKKEIEALADAPLKID